jgi:hypothetical protein
MHFILALVEHRVLGYVLAPYLAKREKGVEYLSIYDRVTNQSLNTYEQLLSPEQIQLVAYIENYNTQNLFKLFSKKKKETPRNFIENLSEEMLAEHVRPYIEKQIVRCFDFLEYNPEPIYHKLLANKIYLSDKLEFITRDCNAIFNFDRNEDGIQYRLTIQHNQKEVSLKDKEADFITNQPCSLVIDNKLFVFKGIDSKKVIPFLDREYISIPKQSEIKYLQTFVRSAIAKYQVRVSGFSITNISPIPKAVISLEKNLRNELSLVLKFIYNKNSIYYANSHSGVKVSCEITDNDVGFLCVNRDYVFENETISKLLSYGLVNKEGAYFEPIHNKSELSGYAGLVTWLNFNRELLLNAQIDIVQKNLDSEYYLGTFELKLEVSEQVNDWFDIMANVQFDDFIIPFVDFKEHISQGNREFVLPNNKVMILPEEWFESYSDLLNFSNKDGSKLKLKKQHFSILNTKVGKLSANFKDSLRQLLKADIDDKETVPNQVDAQLRSYQVDGYSWMYRLHKNRFGGCLADDMGLGKTLQTLTLLQRVVDENADEIIDGNFGSEEQLDLFSSLTKQKATKRTKASLIVVPTSLVHNWVSEKNKFTPSLKFYVYAGSNRGLLAEHLVNYDVIITSYGILRNDLEQFNKVSFLYTVLDESQMIKNPGSKTFAAVMSLKTDYRLVLTGTPIENSLSDLWAQFNFLNPGLLGNFNFFQSEFQIPIEKQHDENKRDRLQQLIAPFLLRRTKDQVAKELPSLSEQVIHCNLNEVQEVYYEREKSKARNLVLENINRLGLKRATMQILQSLMRLRQIANHPILVDDDYIAGSGKFDEITRNLENLSGEGHKALIFSSFVKHLDLVAEWLDGKNIRYAKLTGETRNREKVVEEFQTENDCQFFLVSLKAGGVGLNLTAASYVLMLDPWWNPAAEKQAINRAHRIGQDKQVMVYRFITENTLEEKIVKLQERKSDLADIFINENTLKDISEQEIIELFN